VYKERIRGEISGKEGEGEGEEKVKIVSCIFAIKYFINFSIIN